MRRVGYGEPLRRLRRQHGLTQQEVADELTRLAWTQRKVRVGVDRQMVSKWEREAKQPDSLYRELLCLLYGTSGQALGFGTSTREAGSPPYGSAISPQGGLGQLESPLDIIERMQTLATTNVSDEAIEQLSNYIELVVAEYENAGPAASAARMVQQRRRVDELLKGRQRPRQRDQLYVAAAKLSGLLGYTAVNLGKFPVAKSYCAEAFLLADLAGEKELQAWVRGTESFCAYYQGDYQLSVNLARDGLRYAGQSPQAVRLAVNGEARALAKLGNRRGVTQAVERAYRLSGKFDSVPGVSPCISFGLYSEARTASNAATAYVALGDAEQVREYSDQAMPVFEASESCWSQSLLRLDLANAMVLAPRPEPEQAARLVIEALTISANQPVTSVLTRSREFLSAASRWRDLPAVGEAAEALRAAAQR